MKTRSYHPLPGGALLSLTLRGEQAELHIWAAEGFEETDILTGAGFYTVMSAVKAAVIASMAKTCLIVACDERRQRVFDRYAKRNGGAQVPGIDPDGDPCQVWAF